MRELLLRIRGDASGVLNALRQFSGAMTEVGLRVGAFMRALTAPINPMSWVGAATASVRTLASTMLSGFTLIRQTTGSLTRSLVNVGRSFFFIREITTGIRGFAMALGTSFTGIEKRFENFELRYKALFGGTAEAAEQARRRILQLEEINKTTALDLPGLVELDYRLELVKVHSEEWLKTISNMAVLLGGDVNDNAQRMAVAIGRIASGESGVGIRQLTEIIQAFSRFDLVSRGIRFDASGQLRSSAEEVLTVIQQIMQDRTRGMEEDLVNSWEAIISNARDAMLRVQRAFQQPIAEALKPLFKEIPDIILAPDILRNASILGRVFVSMGRTTTTAVGAMAQGIGTGVSAIINTVGQLIGGFGNLGGTVMAVLGPLTEGFRLLFSGNFAQAGQSIGNALANIRDLILGGLAGLAGQMFNSGQNIIASLANGIYRAARTVIVSAVTFVANTISAFLRGFSPPKEGPLSTIDTWFPLVINAYLGSWRQADWSILTDITDTIADAFERLVDQGKASIAEASRIVLGADGQPGLNQLIAEGMNQIIQNGTISGDLFGQLQSLLGEKYGEILNQITRSFESFKLDRQIRQLESEIAALDAAAEDNASLRQAVDAANKRLREARTFRDYQAAREQAAAAKQQIDKNDRARKILQQQVKELQRQKQEISDIQAGYETINKLLDREQQFLENINRKEKERQSEAERLRKAQFQYALSIASSRRQIQLLAAERDRYTKDNEEWYDLQQQIDDLTEAEADAQKEYARSLMDSSDALASLKTEQGLYSQGSVEYIRLQERIDTLEKERIRRIDDMKKAQFEFDLQNANSAKQRELISQRLSQLNPDDPEQVGEVLNLRQKLIDLDEREADLRDDITLANLDTAGQIAFFEKKQKELIAGSAEELEVQLKLIQLREQLASEQERDAKAWASTEKAMFEAEAEMQDINGQIEMYRARLAELPKNSKEYAQTLKKIVQLEKRRDALAASIAKRQASMGAQIAASKLNLDLEEIKGDPELDTINAISAQIARIDDELEKGNLTEVKRNQLLQKREKLMADLQKAEAAAPYGGMLEQLQTGAELADSLGKATDDARAAIQGFKDQWKAWGDEGERRVLQVRGSFLQLRDIVGSTAIGAALVAGLGTLRHTMRQLPNQVRGSFSEIRALVIRTFNATGGDMGQTIFDLARLAGSRGAYGLHNLGFIGQDTATRISVAFQRMLIGIRTAITNTVGGVILFFQRLDRLFAQMSGLLRAGDYEGVASMIVQRMIAVFQGPEVSARLTSWIIRAFSAGDYGRVGSLVLRSMFGTADFGDIAEIFKHRIRTAFANIAFGDALSPAISQTMRNAGALGDTGALSGRIEAQLTSMFGEFDWYRILNSWWVEIPLAIASGYAGMRLIPLLAPFTNNIVNALQGRGFMGRLIRQVRFNGRIFNRAFVKAFGVNFSTLLLAPFNALNKVPGIIKRFVMHPLTALKVVPRLFSAAFATTWVTNLTLAFSLLGRQLLAIGTTSGRLVAGMARVLLNGTALTRVATAMALQWPRVGLALGGVALRMQGLYATMGLVLTRGGGAVAGLTRVIGPSIAAIGRWTIGWRQMGTAVSYVATLFPRLGSTLGRYLFTLQTFFVRFGGFRAFLTPLIAQFTRFGAVLGVVWSRHLGPLRLAITTLLSPVGRLLGFIGPLVSGFLSLVGPLMGLLAPFASLLGPMIAFAAPVLAIGGALAFLALKVPLVDQVIQFIIDRIPGLVDAIVGFFALMVNYIGQNLPAIIEKLGGWISQIGPPILGGLAKMVGILVLAIVQYGPGIARALVQWGSMFLNWIRTLWSTYVAPNVGPFLRLLLDWISRRATEIGIKLGEWATQFGAWIGPAVQRFLTNWPAQFNRILTTFGNAVGPIISKLAAWGLALIGWIVPRIPDLIKNIGLAVAALVIFIGKSALVIAKKFRDEWAPALYKWITTTAIPALSTAWNGFTARLGELIGGAAKTIWAKLVSMGRDIINGIIRGIELVNPVLGRVMRGVLGNTVAQGKDEIKAKSPSQLTEEELGEPMGEGVVVGIENTEDDIENAMRSALDVGDVGATEVGETVGEQFVEGVEQTSRTAGETMRDTTRRLVQQLTALANRWAQALAGTPAGDEILALTTRAQQLLDADISDAQLADQFALIARDIRTNMEAAFANTDTGYALDEFLVNASKDIEEVRGRLGTVAQEAADTMQEAVGDEALPNQARETFGEFYNVVDHGTAGAAQTVVEMKDEIIRVLQAMKEPMMNLGREIAESFKNGLNEGLKGLTDSFNKALIEVDMSKIDQTTAAILAGINRQLALSPLQLAYEANVASQVDLDGSQSLLREVNYAPAITVNGSGLNEDQLQTAIQDALEADRVQLIRDMFGAR